MPGNSIKDNLPIVSICIPTYGRVEILKKTIDSIYSQNVDNNLFEICISDNSPTDETKQLIEEFFFDKENIKYSKSNCEGYYNSIEALRLGKGHFLKLHNNYTKFNNDGFVSFVQNIEPYREQDSLLFFSTGALRLNSPIGKYESFDNFLYTISYFSTWSTSFCIRKEAFDNLMNNNISLNKMFPHTSLLFALYSKKSFVVDDNPYFENQDVGKKGGYNLPETFGNCYLDMVDRLYEEKAISQKTSNRIYKGILSFISEWYLNCKVFSDKYTFSYDGWKSVIKKRFGKKGVYCILINYILNLPKFLIKKLMRHY